MVDGQVQQTRWLFAFLAFSSLLCGMLAQGGYSYLTGVSTSWRWNPFLAPLLVSPMIFGTFLSIIKSEIDVLTGVIMAFQNGFFWKQIFDGLTPILKAAS